MSKSIRRLRVPLLFALGGVVALVALSTAAERRGGPGDDRIEGTDQGDVLSGGAGNDTLDGGAGRDELDGGPDSDTLDGGAGDDRLYGGSCETGRYGRFCDNPGHEARRGGPGSDDLRALECVTSYCASDRYSALASELDGGPGHDRLTGGSHDDRLAGGSGADRLRGLGGRDHLMGGSGRDRLHARDRRRDRVDCGPGTDTAIVDRKDVVRRCERTRRR